MGFTHLRCYRPDVPAGTHSLHWLQSGLNYQMVSCIRLTPASKQITRIRRTFRFGIWIEYKFINPESVYRPTTGSTWISSKNFIVEHKYVSEKRLVGSFKMEPIPPNLEPIFQSTAVIPNEGLTGKIINGNGPYGSHPGDHGHPPDYDSVVFRKTRPEVWGSRTAGATDQTFRPERIHCNVCRVG